MNLHDPNHRAQLASLARQTGFSEDAVATMRDAIVAGGGRMAQFDHAEFGGSGQWMRGGLLMVGTFDDEALRARVGQLCDALSTALAGTPAVERPVPDVGFQRQSQTSGGVTRVQDSREPSAAGWPASFGAPDTTGAQDGSRYAWFAGARRLVVDHDGRRTIYDTADHRIAGASQQQGTSSGGSGPVFTTESGPLALDRLRVVDDADGDGVGRGLDDGGDGAADDRLDDAADDGLDDAADDGLDDATRDRARPAPGEPPTAPSPRSVGTPPGAAAPDPFAALERLADLHARGIVDAQEFAAKKAELLARI